MAARKGDRRDKILDSAESLFASRGFDATSTRDIVAASGDTLGTLSHHFGSKNNLLRHVVERRFADLDAARRQMYDDLGVEMHGQPRTLQQAMSAIVLPFVQKAFCPDIGWRNYTQLLGRMMRTSDPVHRQFVFNLRTPYTERYLEWFGRALPQYGEDEVRYAYDMMIATMIGACSDVGYGYPGRHEGELEPAFDQIAPRLMAFISAGVLEMLALSSRLSR